MHAWLQRALVFCLGMDTAGTRQAMSANTHGGFCCVRVWLPQFLVFGAICQIINFIVIMAVVVSGYIATAEEYAALVRARQTRGSATDISWGCLEASRCEHIVVLFDGMRWQIEKAKKEEEAGKQADAVVDNRL